jgi:hypothetical protein
MGHGLPCAIGSRQLPQTTHAGIHVGGFSEGRPRCDDLPATESDHGYHRRIVFLPIKLKTLNSHAGFSMRANLLAPIVLPRVAAMP